MMNLTQRNFIKLIGFGVGMVVVSVCRRSDRGRGGKAGQLGGLRVYKPGYTIPHTMYIHGAQFQAFECRVSSNSQFLYQKFSYGFVDDGWKDTVLVMLDETVRLPVCFELPCMYLHHCHNLEHEDTGMMRNYSVV